MQKPFTQTNKKQKVAYFIKISIFFNNISLTKTDKILTIVVTITYTKRN